jgi:hypothetical protein
MKYISFIISSFVICYIGIIATGMPKFNVIYSTQSDSATIGITRLNFDGFYSSHDTSLMACEKKANELYKVVNPIIFMATGRVFYDNHGVSYGLPDFNVEYYQHRGVGDYYIINDSVFAKIPSAFAIGGMRMRLFEANYIGYIKNKDTIIGWKMVAPYPNVKSKLNNYFIRDTTPKTLYFIKYDGVKYINHHMK